MYLGFFHLSELPFRLSPDARFAFPSRGHADALACVRTVLRGGGCAIVTGAQGAGKTLLLECLASAGIPSTGFVRVDYPPRSVPELLEVVLAKTSGEQAAREAPDPETAAARLLAELAGNRRRFALVIDDAHLLNRELLAAVLARDLSRPLPPEALPVVLLGQLSLTRSIDSILSTTPVPTARVRFELPPLAADELPQYIEHRLKVAGGSGPWPFADDVYSEIYRQTQGNPRRINALCDAALVVACERELRHVRLAELQRALENVGWIASAAADAEATAAADAKEVVADGAAEGMAFARLRISHAGLDLTERELTRGRLRIGRAPGNELRIDSHYVSRNHCQILTTEEMSMIEDVRSTNGLYVNSRRVRSHRLRDGDRIQVGEHELQYVDLRARTPRVG